MLVDVGFGTSAVTTHQLAAAFPGHRVIGLERDASRVEAGRREFPGLELVHGDLDALADGQALVVRAANVARGLGKDDAEALHLAIAPKLVEDGLCLEGSTDVEGHVSAFWVARRRGARLEKQALVFTTDGARGFSPWLFRDVLPRSLRRDVKPGTPIFQLLSEWEAAWVLHRGVAPLEAFRASGGGLATTRPDVQVAGDFVVWRQT